jgi:hypothetical protein
MSRSPVSKSFGSSRRKKPMTLCSDRGSGLGRAGRCAWRLPQGGCRGGQGACFGGSGFGGSGGGLGGFSVGRGPGRAGSGIRFRRYVPSGCGMYRLYMAHHRPFKASMLQCP